MKLLLRFAVLCSIVVSPLTAWAADAEPAAQSSAGQGAISYYKQIRPIFQAQCNGCHQPAKASGKFVMTDFAKLLAGGESAEAAIVPGKPDESNLIKQITPVDGKADMPKDRPMLALADIERIKTWISQGAKDDSEVYAAPRYDQDHPPVYAHPNVIPSLDFSPDGKLLAVAGFNEVLLVEVETGAVVNRLVGKSERVESVRFSPDGTRLAVTGGVPAESGEVQVWDVVARKQVLSVPVGFNVVYGANWSPDGKLISFGCGDGEDNSVRAIDAASGEQVLFMGTHSDWVRETTFSVDGKNIVSVSRDMSVKLTEVATQRFIDNVTSITPGVLKGGTQTVVRHPKLDHIIVGGSDGVPKAYRIFRETARIIGDDANLIFDLSAMTGRVFSARFSADGHRIACASCLDGHGEVTYSAYDYEEDVPKNLIAIMGKVPGSRNADERKALEDYKAKGTKLVWRLAVAETPIYAVAIHPAGKLVAAAGGDGVVRLVDAESGSIVKQFSPAPITPSVQTVAAGRPAVAKRPVEALPTEVLPEGAKVVSLDVQPTAITLGGRYEYVQLLVTAALESGDVIDVTRIVAPQLSNNLVEVNIAGLVQPKAEGEGQLALNIGGQTATVPVRVGGLSQPTPRDFVQDVAPVLSKLGCNAGTCHGSAQGKNGLKLSLRGYDPVWDVRALTDDLAGRRVNPASPDRSLMLLKASAGVPHMGGQLTKENEAYYEILRDWIHSGAKLNASPKVSHIEMLPQNPVIPRIGGRQQIRVVATYADGHTRDVTSEAFIESNNSEVSTASKLGLMTAVRRGEAAILARYEGAYAATTLTVMGDREGFAWKEPHVWGRVDELTAAKWKRMKIEPSELANDVEFLRRVHLDLTGLPPTSDEVKAFLADTREPRVKRDEVIDRLVGSPAYIDYWTNKWADLLDVNRKFLDSEGAAAYRQWIRDRLTENMPYDKLVQAIITAKGSNHENPAASYYKILREPAPTMENTTHLFLGVRFNCNKCHDHPFERWTQDQYYQTAAYFAQVDLKADPASGDRKIGGTAVEGAKPLYEIVSDAPSGEITHVRTGQVAAPAFPFSCSYTVDEKAPRRDKLAAWITSADNPYFARSYVNRLWGYLLGVGIIEPIDDLRAGNPASNPELLDYLTQEFIASNFNVQHVIKLIAKSRTYQLSFVSNRWNQDDKINYSHATARRLPAEVLYDTVYTTVGSQTKLPGVKPGTRAAELPDSGVDLPSGFLATFGRPVRESACECERSSGLQLGPVMALISGPTIAEAISDPGSNLAKLVASEPDDRKVIAEIFLRVLNRPVTEAEVEAALKSMHEIPEDHVQLHKLLAEREAAVAPLRVEQERKREEAIAAAKGALAAYEKEITPRLAEEKKAKDEDIANHETELKKYEEKLPTTQAEWEKKQGEAGEWISLLPSAVATPPGVTATVQSDRTIFAQGKGRGNYTVDFRTDLRNITAIRIEALTDERLPSKGSGLADDGNFVLTELALNAESVTDPAKKGKVTLEKARADFVQQGFNPAQVLDGNPNDNQGWAVSPMPDTSHLLVVECKEPIGYEGGTKLSFSLRCTYPGEKWVLGKFRISVLLSRPPATLGVADDLLAIIRTPADKRGPQAEVLAKYFRGIDPDLRRLQQVLAKAKEPAPVDPKLKELGEQVALVSQPVPMDGKLKQLREDVEISAGQLASARLVAAQDLAWALINSPAFLFNH